MPNSSKLILEPRLAAKDAPGLLAQLSDLRGQDVEIDASAVATVSTLCVQVLLAAAQGWRADRSRLGIVRPSEPFLQALDNLGVASTALEAGDAAS